MMRPEWMNRVSSVDDDLGARFADASDAVAARLRSANQVLRERGASGLDAARDLSGDLIVGARRMSRSTRDFAAERPIETALLVGVVGFALGWMVRRMRREPAPRAVASRTTSRSKSSRSK